MLSRQDIIDFCGLTEDEVRTIARRERVSDISAASLGQSLLQSSNRIKEVERFDDDELDDQISSEETDAGEDLQQAIEDFKHSHRCSHSDVDLQ